MALTDAQQQQMFDKVNGLDLKVEYLMANNKPPEEAAKGQFAERAINALARIEERLKAIGGK